MLVIVTGVTWAGWISLLPLASVGVTTIGYWTNNAQKIRFSQLCGSPCTLVYDALIHTWGGVLSESITLVSIIVSIFRFGWKELGSESA
ncbi:MAG: YgjV family protein [Bacillota bacterium]|nr:YgjV family protein [Bacillota bacterium]